MKQDKDGAQGYNSEVLKSRLWLDVMVVRLGIVFDLFPYV